VSEKLKRESKIFTSLQVISVIWADAARNDVLKPKFEKVREQSKSACSRKLILHYLDIFA
jgi:hypothetical protein